MRKITKRMACEIYRRGFVLTKKYEYYENKADGNIYRMPVELLGTMASLDSNNYEFVCSHAELCDIAFSDRG